MVCMQGRWLGANLPATMASKLAPGMADPHQLFCLLQKSWWGPAMPPVGHGRPPPAF
eukprot:NODE_3110_length_979_cov_5.647312_g2592_i0.p4 GENE.NODE_3110_length_979_cov_5.647312_g2592_i0~~NODE_3110_length_979_cov_5.647312_g2592_i0.p4  ORF type:complete len:57 (+),score=2.45 NODE_3110_length_979_cov_5.647312_g2592_i0:501-671(+)